MSDAKQIAADSPLMKTDGYKFDYAMLHRRFLEDYKASPEFQNAPAPKYSTFVPKS